MQRRDHPPHSPPTPRFRSSAVALVIALALGGGATAIAAAPGGDRSQATRADDNGPPLTPAPSRAVPWRAVQIAPTGGARNPTDEDEAVSCASAHLCVAVGSLALPHIDDVLTSTNPASAAEWTLAWTAPTVDGGLNSVSCPSEGLCVAVGNGGHVVTSTDPGFGPWSTANVDSARDASGRPAILMSVGCATVALCVAVDDAGNVTVSTDPAGGSGAWTTAHVDELQASSRPNSVSCPSTTLCLIATTNGVLTSINPTGGARAWNLTQFPGANRGYDVACPNTSLCVATTDGGFFTTSTPAVGSSWRYESVSPQSTPSSVSCPTVSLCIAGDSGYAYLLETTDPAGGPGAWNAIDILEPPPNNYFYEGQQGSGFTPATSHLPTSISCATASFCVAVNGTGAAYVSTTPTEAWGSLAISKWLAQYLFPPGDNAPVPSADQRLFLFPVSQLEPGAGAISWYAPRASSRLIASGHWTARTAAAMYSLALAPLHFTAVGVQLIAHAKPIPITFTESFTPTGQATVVTSRDAILQRAPNPAHLRPTLEVCPAGATPRALC